MDSPAKKGFRQPKKPTKGDMASMVQQELPNIKATMQFQGQQLWSTMRQLQQTNEQLTHLANLIRMEDKAEAAEEGNTVVVDAVATLDGKLFEGAFMLGTVFKIGSGRLLPDFESAMVGMTPGETKKFDLKFPEEYAEELKGKTAKFTVTVLRVLEDRQGSGTVEGIYKELKAAEEAEQKAAAEKAKAEAPQEAPETKEA